MVGEFLEQYLTVDNYNRVRDDATQLKEADPGDLDRYSFRDSMNSIFRTGPGGQPPVMEQVAPQPEQAQPRQPQRSGGGIFNRIFRRER